MYIQYIYTNKMANLSTKKLISLRMDLDILNWFKTMQPRGYQTYIHSILKDYVEQNKEKKLYSAGRAQEIFRKYHAQCFWHYDENLTVDTNNIHLVIEGLRKYGGKDGLILAQELSE